MDNEKKRSAEELKKPNPNAGRYRYTQPLEDDDDVSSDEPSEPSCFNKEKNKKKFLKRSVEDLLIDKTTIIEILENLDEIKYQNSFISEQNDDYDRVFIRYNAIASLSFNKKAHDKTMALYHTLCNRENLCTFSNDKEGETQSSRVDTALVVTTPPPKKQKNTLSTVSKKSGNKKPSSTSKQAHNADTNEIIRPNTNDQEIQKLIHAHKAATKVKETLEIIHQTKSFLRDDLDTNEEALTDIEWTLKNALSDIEILKYRLVRSPYTGKAKKNLEKQNSL